MELRSQTAIILRNSKSEIMQTWENKVRENLPAAQFESKTSLRDSIPDFLDDLILALETNLNNAKVEIIKFAHKHGSERANASEYSIEDALTEYNILRRVIFKYVEQSGPLPQIDRDIILESINFGLTKAGAEYTKLQIRQLNEKNEELKKSETSFKVLANSVPQLVWSATPEGQVDYYNDKVTFYEGAECIDGHWHWQVLVHPEDEEHTVSAWLDAVTSGKEYFCEHRVKTKLGEYRWHLSRAVPLRNDHGVILKWFGTATDIHIFKMAEEALRLSEEKYKKLFQNAPVGMGEVDPVTHKFVRANPKYLEMLGYTEEELKSLTVEEISHPIDAKEDSLFMQIVASGKAPSYRKEKRYLRKDGTYMWAEVSVTSFKTDASGRSYNIAVAQDVTERKKAEEALNDLARDLKQITDIQPTLIGYLNPDFTYKFANKTYQTWFNRTEDQVIGHPAKEVIGKKAFESIKKYFESALKGKRSEYEQWMNFPLGERYVHAVYNPDIKSDGTIEGVFISVSDRTEEKIYLDSLKSSEEQFISLANSIPQLAWMADHTGSIFWYNNRWYEYTGTTSQEMLGWGWKSVHHPDYVEKVTKKFVDRIASGEIWEDTFPLRDAKGNFRWFLSRAMPIKNESGDIIRWFGTNTDVTDNKILTDSLHEEQILRDKFVSTLTHDLRTPLTAAKMSSQLIMKKTEDEKIQSYAYKIGENLDRADKMIQDLLDASKIRAGKGISPTIEKIDLMEVTSKALDDLSTIHGDRFKLNGPKELEVYMCPNGIRRVIENLCNNAIKYGSSHENVNITVVYGHHNVSLCVHNKGNPLINVDKQKLFEPFQQGTATEIAGTKGWGIGLTIVKGVAEAHGGRVAVDSNDEGTTFKIIVPIDARHVDNNSTSKGVRQ